jgi:hypothetical protein
VYGTPIIPEFRMLKQEDYEFKASLDYKASLSPAWATQHPVSTTTTKKKQDKGSRIYGSVIKWLPTIHDDIPV